jgi:hypothetical protein
MFTKLPGRGALGGVLNPFGLGGSPDLVLGGGSPWRLLRCILLPLAGVSGSFLVVLKVITGQSCGHDALWWLVANWPEM